MDFCARTTEKGNVVNDGLVLKFHSTKGARNPQAKLNVEQVEEIRALYATNLYSQTKLAKQFGISQSTVSAIINKRIWGD